MKLLFAIFIILLASQLDATNYYVAKRGNDANTGLDTANAFLTIARLVDSCDAPGDTGWVCAIDHVDSSSWNEQNDWSAPAPGTDRRATLVTLFSGTAANNIFFKAFIGGSFDIMPTITGINTARGDSLFNQGIVITQEDHITFDSLLFDSCGMAGIYIRAAVDDGCDSITIINCQMTNIYELAPSFGEANTGGIYYDSPTEPAWRVPDSMAGNNGLIFRNVTVSGIFDDEGNLGTHDNLNCFHGRGLRDAIIDSCDLARAYGGIRFKTDCDRNLAVNNRIHNLNDAGVHFGNEPDRNIVQFNLMWDVHHGVNGRTTISAGSSDSSYFNVFANNTVFLRGDGGSTGMDPSVSTLTVLGSIDGYYVNNIIVDYSGGLGISYAQDISQNIWDYNCYFSVSEGEVLANVGLLSTADPFSLINWRIFSTDSLGFSADQNSINEDPLFLNTTDSSNANFGVPDPLNSPAVILNHSVGIGDTLFNGVPIEDFMGFVQVSTVDTLIKVSGNVTITGKVTVPGE